MARVLGGRPEASAARCLDADRAGLDLVVATPAGEASVRVLYEEPIEGPEELRKATVKLAHRARAALDR
jgi:putative heme iron utilization protein